MYFAKLSNFFESFSLYYYLSQSEYFPFFCFARLMSFLHRHLDFRYSPYMSWYTASNSTNQIAEQLIYSEWLYYNTIYLPPPKKNNSICLHVVTHLQSLPRISVSDNNLVPHAVNITYFSSHSDAMNVWMAKSWSGIRWDHLDVNVEKVIMSGKLVKNVSTSI
jgi:hypothetical protein